MMEKSRPRKGGKGGTASDRSIRQTASGQERAEDAPCRRSGTRRLPRRRMPCGSGSAGSFRGYLRPVGSPIESVELPDDFLEWMEREGIPVLAIPGNRGTPERLHFGSRIFSRRGIHIARTGRVYPGLPYVQAEGAPASRGAASGPRETLTGATEKERFVPFSRWSAARGMSAEQKKRPRRFSRGRGSSWADPTTTQPKDG